MRASPADGLAITGLSWKGSRGGSVREVRGGTCPLSSGRGKRCGSAITVGTCDEVFAHVAAVFGVDAEVAEDIEKLLSVDSTNVRAHQHSAGACSDTLATGGTVELQEIRR